MEKFRQHFLLAFLSSLASLHLVHAKLDQRGFISIDCGSNSSSVSSKTGINYVADEGFSNTGTVGTISPDYQSTDTPKEYWKLKSFPDGTTNCYSIKVETGTKYLIRTTFFYGNYDGRNKFPKFDLYFGSIFWDTVIERVNSEFEIIHITKSNYVHICFVKNGSGIPFVSTIELRPLPNSVYKSQSGSLGLYQRTDIGSLDNQTYRYPDDIYDRIWSPLISNDERWITISTSSTINHSFDDNGFRAPSVVLRTASTILNGSSPMEINWMNPNLSNQFFIYLFFAELEKLQDNQSRLFRVFINGVDYLKENVNLWYLDGNSVRNGPLIMSENYKIQLIMSNGSTLPPILNAIEIYKAIDFTQSETQQDDADAIIGIKSFYGVTKNWQGDPCAPKTLAWQGLNCNYDGLNAPRITVLNLSSSGLTGEITSLIWNLKELEVLDLSNNNLIGQVPRFLAQMPSLRVLNLKGNSLSHQIPAELIDKQSKGILLLSLDGDLTSNQKSGKNIVLPIVASVGGVVVVLIGISVVVYCKQQRTRKRAQNEETFELRRQCYSYSDVLRITNNFERLLGEGGFGKVYYGVVDNIEVAVKMLSPTSVQGFQQFQAEIDVLLRVHHRNLISLIGYCKDEKHIGLVYEYMERGNLRCLLSGLDKGEVLSWNQRLQIALDAAQGLEYLHNGCKPPIIHRDIKTANILLNKKLQAKITDFGLSKAFSTEGGASDHMTTNLVGTFGYLDPEFQKFYRLTEKSDVYSFGVVLLEIITGRPVFCGRSVDETSYITQWVNHMIKNGEINSIIDPNLRSNCDTNSAWKVIDIGMSCVSNSSAARPTMIRIVNELRECLEMEMNQIELDHKTNSVTYSSICYDSTSGLSAR